MAIRASLAARTRDRHRFDGASVLLSIKPTREFIREHVYDQDLPFDLLGVDCISVQPRLGINGDWGGVINFDLQKFIHPLRSR